MTFPVSWQPGEDERFWFWDQSHWPHPTTPLAATLELPTMAEGFTRACRALRRPFPAYHARAINGFVYFGFDLVRNPAERARATAAHAEVIAQRSGDVVRYWREDVLPEVQAANDRMRFTDWDALDGPKLAAAIDELSALRTRQWELHDMVLVPAMAALETFNALYRRLFPHAPSSEPNALLRGLPNKTTEAATALWRLAQNPQVRRFVESSEPASMRGSSAQPPNLTPLAPFASYLSEYGWRTEGWELSDPALREEPSPLIARLRRYAADHPDPEAALHKASAERERMTAEVLGGLSDAGDRTAFVSALTAAQAYPVLSEDHNFVIDQMGLTALRVPVLVMGRYLATRGLLATPDDVFYLEKHELRDALASGRLTADVAGRRAERERWRGFRPPATLGTPLPPEMADDPLYAGFFGIGADPPAGERVLRGVAGAPGVVSGRARVARTLAEADDLAPGEILVCPMTSPAWTPLFATAAAVVADAGGALSHTAIVAREYGIPCVVATRIACTEISSGEWIEVDGDAGEVRRLGRR
jgi:rifampicin phosphotransferase